MLDTYPISPNRRSIALAATLALHMMLFAGFQLSRKISAPEQASRTDTYELLMIPLKQPKPAHVALPEPMVRRAETVALPRPVKASAPKAVEEPEPITQAIAPPQAVAAPPQASKSADEIMQQARRDVGKIDKDLRKAYPGGPIKAPGDSPHMRMQKGMDLAHDLAPPGLFEAPKITEVIDPGQVGRKRYRVVTGNGTYCLTYDSVNSPGFNAFRQNNSPQAKISNCPANEQPATKQKW